MVLYFTAKDQQGLHREFFCQLDKIDTAFEFLSDLVSKGSSLTQAYILQDGSRTDLPLIVFDGEPFLEAMQELENEWLILLSDFQLVNQNADNQDKIIGIIQQRVRQFDTKIIIYQKVITQLELLLQRTHTNFSPGPLKDQIVSQYESMISRNQKWLIKAQLSHKAIVERLTRLGG